MNELFGTVKANGPGLLAIMCVRQLFNDFLEDLDLYVPDGRYRSIIKTKLEETCFFAVKGVLTNPEFVQKLDKEDK